MKTFIRDIFVYGVGGMLARFVVLFTTPIYTRFLDTEEFGTLDLIASIAAILLILASMEIHSGYGRNYYESKARGDIKKLRGSIMVYIVFINILLLSSFTLLYQPLSNWTTIIKMNLMIPVVLNIMPALVISILLVTIRFEEKPVAYSLVTLSQVGLTGITGIFSVIYLDLGVYGILWSTTIVSWLIFIFTLFLLPEYTKFSINLKHLKSVLFYSAPIVPAVLAGWVNKSVARVFIAASLSLSMLGVYSIALKVGLVMSLATNAFKLTWSPMANKYFLEPGSEPKFALALKYYLVIFTAIVVGLTSLGPLIVKVLASAPYYEATAYVGLIIVAQMWDGITNIVAAGNNWERKTYYNSIGSIIAGVISVLILSVWIKDGGIFLASIVLLVGSIVKSGIILITAQRNHPIPYLMRHLLFVVIMTSAFAYFSYFSFINTDLLWWQFSLMQLVVGMIMVFITDKIVMDFMVVKKTADFFGGYLKNG